MGKTRGVHETTPEIRNRMVGMYEAGLGLKEIAAAVNCSQRTVKRWLNRFDREGNVDTRERCGRKRATTHEQDEAIVRLATQTPITAAKAVLPALGLNCSVDTIRERLHKAGIHNWSPSRKHIQKISIAPTDGAEIQQAVWRPTGTQLGKKKLTKEPVKSKSSSPPTRKKTAPRKAKSKKVFDEDGAPSGTAEQIEVQQPNFSFPSTSQNELAPSQMNEMQTLPAPAPLPPPPPPVPPTAPHPAIPSNSNQYSHPLNLIPQSQPIYHHHPGLNVSQNWPLDLVQNAHHYAQSQQSIPHEQHAVMHVQSHPQIHSHHDAQLPHHMQEQIQASIHPQQCDVTHQKLDSHPMNVESHQDLAQAEFSQSEDGISNVCIDVCSNSNASSAGNSQHLSMDDEVSSDNNSSPSKGRRTSRSKKKKGGKIKGTLETSVEIRNRMIGMSEAGLSTLSIALAINRSERTVKRWLDRWHKEGNVQTKERKGRRRITTKEEDDAIIALATQQPLTAAKHVAPALGLKCSVDTIRERLHKAGIHSWKLGKKQGVGNAVHTVHLWQPSGNRSNKVKSSGNKKRRTANKKRNQNTDDISKQTSKKPSDETSPEISPPAATVIHQEPNLQFQNQSQSPPVMQTTHELATNAEFIQPRPLIQAPPICTQGPLPPQAMAPIMQPRSDCRLSLSALAPSLPSQANANLSYSSCMLGNTSHTTHMEQADPMNYEPYIWSF